MAQPNHNNSGGPTPFDLGAVTPLQYFAAIAIGLGLVFAFIAPDESTGFIQRLFQWQLQTWIPMLLLIGCHALIHRFAAIQALSPWVRLAISGALGAVLFSPLALMVDVGLGQQEIDSSNWLAAWLDEIGGVVPPVVIAWVAINAPWVANWRMQKLPAPNQSSVQEPDAGSNRKDVLAQGVLSRLPVDNVDQILSIKSELHYLSVNTTAGKSMVLYNLKDAVNELNGDNSLQPHRSYWVNQQHVERLQRVGRQSRLILADGSAIPVSRSRLPQIQEALGARPGIGKPGGSSTPS